LIYEVNMHSGEKDLGTILAFIILISSLSQATSYNPNISVSSPPITGGLGNIELIYDPSPPPAIFPIERWGKIQDQHS